MKRILSTMAMGAIVAGMAQAAPGECTVSGQGTFACDLALDGAGLTFALPDGQVFTFALTEAGRGLGYLIAPDAAPGQRPDELGDFTEVPAAAGCWVSERDPEFRFCASVEQ